MSSLQDLENRLSELEKLVQTLNDLNTSELSNEKYNDAEIATLRSIVIDLAEHAGVSPKELQKHYDTRFRYWHDWFLRKVEETSPSLAAEVDKRGIGECGVTDSYPPLFDPPASDK